jgi:hypothetical protein
MRSLLVACLALGAAGAAFRPLLAAAPSAGSSGSLAAALETVSAGEIRADIFFVASDELEGRDTVSEGQRVAARFLRSRLERLGVPPGAPGGYFFEYPLWVPRLVERETHARWTSAGAKDELTFGRDYFFASRAVRDLALEGPVVFCGKGARGQIGPEVAGKWALVLDDGGLVGDLTRELEGAGALGALMTPEPGGKAKPYRERFSRDVAVLTRGSARWPSKSSEKDEAEAKDVPMLWLTGAAAAEICPELGIPGAALPPVGTELAGRFSHARKLAGQGGTVMAENVCGWWPGNDPELADEVIIVSAHYDHVGYGGGTEIHNGADDNGSGTCGLLALAEALTVHGPLRRSVLLMWVSGEEKGLWGSQAWTENPWLPDGARAVCDINIDMIGRNAPDYLLITPTSAHKNHNGLVRLAEQVAPLEGFPKLGSCDAYWSRSDHINFANRLKIPVTFLFSDVHDDYHQPGDDPEKIDYDKIRRVVRVVMRMIAGLQEDRLDL